MDVVPRVTQSGQPRLDPQTRGQRVLLTGRHAVHRGQQVRVTGDHKRPAAIEGRQYAGQGALGCLVDHDEVEEPGFQGQGRQIVRSGDPDRQHTQQGTEIRIGLQPRSALILINRLPQGLDRSRDAAVGAQAFHPFRGRMFKGLLPERSLDGLDPRAQGIGEERRVGVAQTRHGPVPERFLPDRIHEILQALPGRARRQDLERPFQPGDRAVQISFRTLPREIPILLLKEPPADTPVGNAVQPAQGVVRLQPSIPVVGQMQQAVLGTFPAPGAAAIGGRRKSQQLCAKPPGRTFMLRRTLPAMPQPRQGTAGKGLSRRDDPGQFQLRGERTERCVEGPPGSAAPGCEQRNVHNQITPVRRHPAQRFLGTFLRGSASPRRSGLVGQNRRLLVPGGQVDPDVRIHGFRGIHEAQGSCIPPQAPEPVLQWPGEPLRLLPFGGQLLRALRGLQHGRQPGPAALVHRAQAVQDRSRQGRQQLPLEAPQAPLQPGARRPRQEIRLGACKALQRGVCGQPTLDGPGIRIEALGKPEAAQLHPLLLQRRPDFPDPLQLRRQFPAKRRDRLGKGPGTHCPVLRRLRRRPTVVGRAPRVRAKDFFKGFTEVGHPARFPVVKQGGARLIQKPVPVIASPGRQTGLGDRLIPTAPALTDLPFEIAALLIILPHQVPVVRHALQPPARGGQRIVDPVGREGREPEIGLLVDQCRLLLRQHLPGCPGLGVGGKHGAPRGLDARGQIRFHGCKQLASFFPQCIPLLQKDGGVRSGS